MKTAKLVLGPATSKVVPPITNPKESDYSSKRAKQPGHDFPVDTFLKKTESHDKRVKPAVKAKSLSKTENWEAGSNGTRPEKSRNFGDMVPVHKHAKLSSAAIADSAEESAPSYRTFPGSKTPAGK